MLELDDFPENCGVSVITRFDPEWRQGIEAGPGKYVQPTAADLMAQVKYARHEQSNGMVFATINSEQVNANAGLHELLQTARFKCLATFENPNSGNQVWIYYKLLVRARRKPVIVKRRTRAGGLVKGT